MKNQVISLAVLALINNANCVQREPLLSYGKVRSAYHDPGIKYPINYKVPNFGVDNDITDSLYNLKNTEKVLGHKLDLKAGGRRATGVDNFDNHPMNYKVPNFGMDQDIIDTQNHLKQAEKRLGKWKVFVQVDEDSGVWIEKDQEPREPLLSAGKVETAAPREKITYPINYKVPNFGVDQDIVDSQKNLDDAEKKLGKWKAFSQTEREPLLSYGKVRSAYHDPGIKYPINYKVPNFGVDNDISDSLYNLKNTEKVLGHKLDLKAGGRRATGVDNFDNHPMNYKVPNFGMDQDIVDTQNHLKQAEKRLGKWKIFTQLDQEAERDPLLSKPYPDTAAKRYNDGHPVDYFVPNFGLDADIVSTQQHTKKAEEDLVHSWQPKKGGNGKYVVPHEDVEFKL